MEDTNGKYGIRDKMEAALKRDKKIGQENIEVVLRGKRNGEGNV